jgi:hypothetical protein
MEKLIKKITTVNLKSVLVVTVLCVVSGFLSAQDVITFTDGRKVEAKVIEVDYNMLKYKRHNNESGPLYTTRIYLVHRVQYSDGTVEEYSPLKEKPKSVETKKKKEKTKPKEVLSSNGFFIDGNIGVTTFERTEKSGTSVNNALGYGNTDITYTGRYSEAIPVLGFTMGSKFYFGDRERNYVHGMQMTWIAPRINLQRFAGIDIVLLNPGYTGMLKFERDMGLELNLSGGFSVLARDISTQEFGYFIVPSFDPIVGYNVSPGVKFRKGGFALGLQYSYAGTIGVKNDPVYNSLSFTIGRKF